MDRISPEQKTLLSLLGHRLFSAPFVPTPNVDWEQVAKEARAQAVFSIAFDQYQQFSLDEELSVKVKKTLMKYALSNTICYKNHTYLHDLMQGHNISYCALKGAVSASYYPDPLLRSMGDVDFYVHPDDIERALQVFRQEGFVCDLMDHPCHISMKNGSKHFEMHFKPVAYRPGPIGDMLEEHWSNIRETAILHEGELATYYGPSTFHHGFILLTHLQHHLFHEGVGLRHFCDWVLFANSLSNDDFVSIFASKLKRIGLYRFARLLSLGAVKHMGMMHKEWMGDDYDTADEILSDIIYGGNFGRKDKQRVQEGLFICDRDTGDMKKGRLRQALSSLNHVVDSHWQMAKKLPILYPVGWLYFSTRYLIRVIFKKRKINLIDTYRKSGARRKKYRKIKPFEPEE